MKTMKRVLALLLVATMAFSLGACGKKKRESAEVKFDANGDYVVPDRVLEIVGWNTQGTDYAMGADLGFTDLTADWLEAKTNVVYKNIYGNDNGSWDAKLTRLVTGKNMPDVVFCGAFQGPAHFNKLDEMNVLYHLTPEMIQKVAPNLWARTPKDCWDAFTVTKDGETYITGIPYNIHVSYDEPFLAETDEFTPYTQEEVDYIRETQLKYETDVTFLSTQCLYIRDDILKDFFPEAKTYDELVEILEETNAPLGDVMLDVPIYSTEELVDFMYAIQAKNYKVDGKTVYPFGYNGGDNWLALSQFGSELMGYKNHNYSGTINYETKRYELFLLSDIVKESARLQNQMLNDEVIESESLAQPTNLYQEKVMNGQYAIAAVNTFNQVGNLNDQLEEMGKPFRYRPFIMQIPNDPRYPAFTEKSMWMNSLALTTTMEEGDVYQYLNWIDTQYTSEWEEIASWGPQDMAKDIWHEENDPETGRTIRKFNDERFNQYFLEGDTNALDDGETLGFGDTSGSEFPVYVLNTTKFQPLIYNRAHYYGETGDGGFRFPPESEHVKNVVAYPPTQIWASIYADIPEVIEYWSTREQWESKTRIALGAKPGEFEARWAELEETMKGIVDIEAMEDACTKAATPYMEDLGMLD
ncbi:MAG: hypothetical protein E7413_04720 [Ruminococcaceae bacterium]|nr:hypothetical protein [Oscillospiraceae bacterium]